VLYGVFTTLKMEPSVTDGYGPGRTAGGTEVDAVTDGGWTRRGVMAATAGAAAAGAAATPAAAQADDLDAWFGESVKGGATSNYDGVDDQTGQSSVTVEVGADGNGGSFAFGPAAVRVDPGTTVTFEWVSDTHNVLVESQPDGAGWQGHEPIENTGFSFEHTFDTEGTYTYYCQPHLSVGMKGAIVVGGGDGGPAAVGEPDYGGWFGESVKGGAVGNYDETVDQRGQSSVTVEVGADGNGGSFAFGPAAVRVDPGTTVTFEWVSDTHNVLVESQPDGAGWQGHEPIENTGFSFEHTFDTGGVYKYYCQPHLSVGMKAAVVVGDVGPSKAGPSVDISGAERALLGVGIGAGMLAPVAFALADRMASAPDEPAPAEDAPAYEPAEELDHDSFTPAGTWRLVLVYLAILVVMWVLVYFVEFLGNGPTVVG
jgi:halocyanin-like protein